MLSSISSLLSVDEKFLYGKSLKLIIAVFVREKSLEVKQLHVQEYCYYLYYCYDTLPSIVIVRAKTEVCAQPLADPDHENGMEIEF